MNWAKSDMGFYVLKVLIVLEKKDGSVTNRIMALTCIYCLHLCCVVGPKAQPIIVGFNKKTN